MQVFCGFLLVFSTSCAFGSQVSLYERMPIESLLITVSLEQAVFNNDAPTCRLLLLLGKNFEDVRLDKLYADKAWKNLIFSYDDPPQLAKTFHDYIKLIKSYQRVRKKLLVMKLQDKEQENIAERIMHYAGLGTFEHTRITYFEHAKEHKLV